MGPGQLDPGQIDPGLMGSRHLGPGQMGTWDKWAFVENGHRGKWGFVEIMGTMANGH